MVQLASPAQARELVDRQLLGPTRRRKTGDDLPWESPRRSPAEISASPRQERRRLEREAAIAAGTPLEGWGEPLGNTWDSFPPSDREANAKRRHLYRLQDFARGLTTNKNRRKCRRIRYEPDVTIRRPVDHGTGELGRSYLHGLVTCGSWSSCPTCSAAIAARRAQEIEAAIKGWYAQGGTVFMATFTLRHQAGGALRPMYEGLSEAFSFIRSGSPWYGGKRKKGWARRIRYAGTVRGTEATHGPNGWHPHIHGLFFITGRPSWREMMAFRRWIAKRWGNRIERNLGPDARPTARRGVRLTGGKSAAWYVAKLGLSRELSGLMNKRGRTSAHRTPIEILNDLAHAGEDLEAHDRDRALWLEWSTAMHGKAQLFWSPGLREKVVPLELQLTSPDVDGDEEIAAAEPEDHIDVAEVPGSLWDRIADLPGIRPSLMDAADRGGSEEVDRVIWGALQLAPEKPSREFLELAKEQELLANKISFDEGLRFAERARREEGKPTAHLLWIRDRLGLIHYRDFSLAGREAAGEPLSMIEMTLLDFYDAEARPHANACSCLSCRVASRGGPPVQLSISFGGGKESR